MADINKVYIENSKHVKGDNKSDYDSLELDFSSFLYDIGRIYVDVSDIIARNDNSDENEVDRLWNALDDILDEI